MQECETGTGKDSIVKRVSVRSGGAGHAQTGVVTGTPTVPKKRVKPIAAHKPAKQPEA